MGKNSVLFGHVSEPIVFVWWIRWKKSVLFASVRSRGDIFWQGSGLRISTTELWIRIWFRIRIVPYHFDTPFSGGKVFFLRIRDILVRIQIRGTVPLTYGSGFGSGSGLSRTNFDTPFSGFGITELQCQFTVTVHSTQTHSVTSCFFQPSEKEANT